MAKVIKINDGLYFDDGSSLTSDHDQDCCEHHYLDFNHHVEQKEGVKCLI